MKDGISPSTRRNHVWVNPVLRTHQRNDASGPSGTLPALNAMGPKRREEGFITCVPLQHACRGQTCKRPRQNVQPALISHISSSTCTAQSIDCALWAASADRRLPDAGRRGRPKDSVARSDATRKQRRRTMMLSCTYSLPPSATYGLVGRG